MTRRLLRWKVPPWRSDETAQRFVDIGFRPSLYFKVQVRIKAFNQGSALILPPRKRMSRGHVPKNGIVCGFIRVLTGAKGVLLYTLQQPWPRHKTTRRAILRVKPSFQFQGRFAITIMLRMLLQICCTLVRTFAFIRGVILGAIHHLLKSMDSLECTLSS